ncbi:hypothetical protein [Ureibacillus sp. FSL W8-0352]|uniref:hypothetical protein n=1 Tax=Ureibacillus sp. FSL W8-0352 TaxID=2954596 RepID=UPI0030F829BA
MSKFEWRKHLKELYLPGTQPTTIHVPPMKFFTIDGKGNPNGNHFKNISKFFMLYPMRFE